MVGENNSRDKLSLDPIVDVALTALGLVILTLMGNQFCLLLQHFFSTVNPILLTLVSLFAAFIGIADRKIRRGQYDLPRTFIALELGVLASVVFCATIGYALFPRLLVLSCVGLVYQAGFDLARWSEELLFDFGRQKEKANWQRGWETEGLRLYDRHIVGFKRLQRLMFFVDGLLALLWIVRFRPGGWAVFAGLLIFFLQIIFLGLAFYQKKRIVWAINGYEVDGQVFKRLLGLLLGVALLFSVVAAVLPVRYNPVPWQAIGNLLNSAMNGPAQNTGLKFPTEARKEQRDDGLQGRLQQMEVKNSWHTILFGILVGAVVLALLTIGLGFILSFIKEEHYRRRGFVDLLVRIYLFFREMVRAIFSSFRQQVHGWQTVLEKRRSARDLAKLQKMLVGDGEIAHSKWVPQNAREEIVKCFLELRLYFTEKGITMDGNQTLSEYSTALLGHFPEVKREVYGMQRLVEESIYSMHAISREAVEEMAQIVGAIREKVDT